MAKGPTTRSLPPGSAPANHRFRAQQATEASEIIARARVVLLQLELPLVAVEAAAGLARAAGARVLLDPAPPQPLTEELLRNLHVIHRPVGAWVMRRDSAERESRTSPAIR